MTLTLIQKLSITAIVGMSFTCHVGANADPKSEAQTQITTVLQSMDDAWDAKASSTYITHLSDDYTEVDISGKEIIHDRHDYWPHAFTALGDIDQTSATHTIQNFTLDSSGAVVTTQCIITFTILNAGSSVNHTITTVTRDLWAQDDDVWKLKRSRTISHDEKQTAETILPQRGTAEKIEPGVLRYEVFLPNVLQNRLWIYLPENVGTKKIPCIFIAPAGTPCIVGARTGAGAIPEHLPYVHAGYAVANYELDGDVPNFTPVTTLDQVIPQIQQFKSADAGLVNARAAIDYVLAKCPEIDPNRLYIAGHSSAGTVSLYVAEHDPRIKACIAYAPACDIRRFIASTPAELEGTIKKMEITIPGFRSWIAHITPEYSADTLKCPVFLFHANDDSNVQTPEIARFVSVLKTTNSQVTYDQVEHGEHYQSMIDDGIPDAIQWLNKISAVKP